MGFVPPSSNTNIEGCKSSCLKSCSCVAMFFEMSSGNCFMFDQIGSLQGSNKGPGYASFIKVSSNDVKAQSGSKNHVPIIIEIVVVTTIATENFNIKLGQGGFDSVYQGTLRDRTRIAVKKLEGIGQGKKEFRAGVGIIESIHHLHLMRLKGFCAQGTHGLFFAYEFMSNGSLERWLFKKDKENTMLDWDTRYNIAVGTAKGLAYLHDDCNVKIVHRDIKPENVLLDDNFSTGVLDFGLTKLMNREQSFVFTTMRGTRGLP